MNKTTIHGNKQISYKKNSNGQKVAIVSFVDNSGDKIIIQKNLGNKNWSIFWQKAGQYVSQKISEAPSLAYALDEALVTL